MLKLRTIVMLVAMLGTQQVMAETAPASPTGSTAPSAVTAPTAASVPATASAPGQVAEDQSCAAIAKSCTAAGFEHTQAPNKNIWHDCMKPVILGNAVTGVTVDATTVKSCRAHKIVELTKELSELKQAG